MYKFSVDSSGNTDQIRRKILRTQTSVLLIGCLRYIALVVLNETGIIN